MLIPRARVVDPLECSLGTGCRAPIGWSGVVVSASSAAAIMTMLSGADGDIA